MQECRKAYEDWVNKHPNTVEEMGGKDQWLADNSQHWHDFRQGWRAILTRISSG